MAVSSMMNFGHGGARMCMNVSRSYLRDVICREVVCIKYDIDWTMI